MLTLSNSLGFPHPDYLLPYLSAKQLDDQLLWMKKYHPFPDRDDIMWGTLLSMFHNVHCEKADALSPADFIPYADKYEHELTAAELRAKLHLP